MDSKNKTQTKEKKVKKNKNADKKNKALKMTGKVLKGLSSSLSNIVLLIFLIILIGATIGFNLVESVVKNLPTVETSNIVDQLTENSIIVDQHGNLLETLYAGSSGMRTKVEYNDISESMVRAITSIEDKTFFEHKGFNYIRLAGAAIESVKSGNKARGTSSITQQLAKNIYLTNESSLERKIKEAYYAIILERSLTKKQILEAYLNKIYLGNNNYGVGAASKFYFSKKPSDLDLVESIIIAGIPKSPNKYPPVSRLSKDNVKPEHIIFDDSDPEYTLVFNPKCQDRFDFSIEQMKNNELITEEEYTSLKNVDISKYIKVTSDKANEISSYFGDMIKQDATAALSEKYGITSEEALSMIYEGGLVIESTIDYEIQKQLEDIYNSIDFSNTFDNATYNAVLTFQSHNNIQKDGSVGPQTLGFLCEQTSYTIDDFTRGNYSKGVVHDEVIALKKALDELGLMNNDGLFPKPRVRFNAQGNILHDDKDKILLYKYSNMINDQKQLIIKKDNYYFDDNGNMVILPNRGLSFYQHSDRVQVVVDPLFRYDEASDVNAGKQYTHYSIISGLYIYKGKDVLIPDEYKRKLDGDLIIDKSFFTDLPDFFKYDENKNILIDEDKYVVDSKGEIQPQSAFVILDHNKGHVVAIVGGRESYGKNIFNRALSPQQPGSSIKPIGPYTAAIKSRQFTAASVIDDVPSFLNSGSKSARWPHNWYEHQTFKYWGRQNLRQGIEYSINVLAVKLADMVGVENVFNQLKDFGITTLVDSGNINDMNLSAVSLGGMTKGISPFELATAYSVFPNKGIYSKPISFTKITDRSGEIIYENKIEKKRILDENVAFIITDMLRTAVSNGLCKKANFDNMTVAGKTGTTSDKRDVLFIGFTPYYTGAVWFGNDVKLKMDEGSEAAAKFWRVVMQKIHEGKEFRKFSIPSGIVTATVDRVSGKRPGELSALDPNGSQVYSEYFISGTVPTETDDSHEKVLICADNHALAGPYCINTEEVVLRKRLEEYDPDQVLDHNSKPILPRDYEFSVPYKECEEHKFVNIDENDGILPVIETTDDGRVIFIRDYNLLLKDNTFMLIKKGSEIKIGYIIETIDGQKLYSFEYDLDYILNPAEQIKAIYENNLLNSEDNEDDENNNNDENENENNQEIDNQDLDDTGN